MTPPIRGGKNRRLSFGLEEKGDGGKRVVNRDFLRGGNLVGNNKGCVLKGLILCVLIMVLFD